VRSLAEHKYWDTQLTFGPTHSFQVNENGIVVQVTGVSPGSSDTTRIGDKVTGTSFQITLNITPSGLITMQPSISHRLIVFIWKDDTNPTAADILQTSTPFPVSTTMPFRPLNHDKKIKRKILIDQTINNFCDLGQVAFAGSANPNWTKKWVIPLAKYGNLAKINYNVGTTDGVNNIWYLIIASGAGLANSFWEQTLYTRYNYIDM
jgi:hypothetical protein